MVETKSHNATISLANYTRFELVVKNSVRKDWIWERDPK